MNLNFFEPFLNASKKSGLQKALLPIVLMGILFIAMIGYTVYAVVSTIFLQKTIDDIDIKLSDPALIAKIKEVDTKEKEIGEIKQEKEYLKTVDSGINDIDTVTRALIDIISKQVTNDLYLSDIKVDVNEISVTGLAKTRAEIAQFEYNVRNTNLFDNIYIERISKSSNVDAQEFGLKMTSKKELYINTNANKTVDNSKGTSKATSNETSNEKGDN